MRRNTTSRPGRREQRGISMVVGLIMLVLMTLLAISAFQASNVNLRIAGNMQVRQETLAAAQTATEQVLSSPAFIDPATPPAPVTVALNGANYTVNFTPAPACKSVVDIPNTDLVDGDAEDSKCKDSDKTPGEISGIFVSGPPAPVKNCSNTRWTLIANVADANTGANTTLEQGVSVRVAKKKALTFCP